MKMDSTFKSTAARFMLPVMVALSVALMPVESRAQQAAPPHGAKDISETLSPLKNEVYSNASSPVGGNAAGDVTIVQFYDYRCGYCKSAEAGLEQLIKEDGNIKIIYKDHPSLSKLSTLIAVAALASRNQGEDKRLKFHQLLLNPQTTVNIDTDIYKVAAAAGLNVKQLKGDMLEGRISIINRAHVDYLKGNLTLGKKLGMKGVPAFIIGDYYLAGAADYNKLKDVVAFVREKQKPKQ